MGYLLAGAGFLPPNRICVSLASMEATDFFRIFLRKVTSSPSWQAPKSKNHQLFQMRRTHYVGFFFFSVAPASSSQNCMDISYHENFWKKKHTQPIRQSKKKWPENLDSFPDWGNHCSLECQFQPLFVRYWVWLTPEFFSPQIQTQDFFVGFRHTLTLDFQQHKYTPWNQQFAPARKATQKGKIIIFLCHPFFRCYCWWKKSQTTTWYIWNPVNTGINYQPQLVSRILSINSMSC